MEVHSHGNAAKIAESGELRLNYDSQVPYPAFKDALSNVSKARDNNLWMMRELLTIIPDVALFSIEFNLSSPGYKN